MIYTALLDSVDQYLIMKKWAILDVRFKILFIYLTHFYKLKFVNVALEKITSKFFDAYNNLGFYANGKSTFLASFFTFLKEELAPFGKLKSNDIFESVFLEAIRKIVFLFLKFLIEIFNHEKFDMPILNVNYLLSEFCTFGKQLKVFSAHFWKSYGLDKVIFEWCTGSSYFNLLAERICQILFDKLVNYVRPVIASEIKNNVSNSLDLSRVMGAIKAKQANFGDLHATYAMKLETLKYDICLEELTKHYTQKGDHCSETQIAKTKDNFVAYMKDVESPKLDDQIVYIEQLAVFFTKPDAFKCQNALSVIQQLLSFKLSKQTLLQLIKTKTLVKNKTVKEQLASTVNLHFERFKQFMDRQMLRQKAYRKLRTFMLCMIFLIKLKRRKIEIDKRKISKINKQNGIIGIFDNEPINLDLINTKINIAVKFQIVNRYYMRSKFKGFSFNDV